VEVFRRKALARSRRRFDWDEIARQTEQVYHSLFRPEGMIPIAEARDESGFQSAPE
jgi:hypothetical protein